MRDLDFDVQIEKDVKRENHPVSQFSSVKEYLEQVALKPLASKFNTWAGFAPDRKGAPFKQSVTTNDTLMLEHHDFEVSFHFHDPDPSAVQDHLKQNLGFNKEESYNSKTLKVIDDATHFNVAKSALESRLSRPDKVWKNIQDPVVIASSLGEKAKVQAGLAQVKNIIHKPYSNVAKIQQITRKYLDLKSTDNTVRDFKGIKTNTGTFALSTVYQGYTKADSLSYINDHYWYPNYSVWSQKRFVKAYEPRTNYDSNFKLMYKTIMNEVLENLSQTAAAENRADVKDAFTDLKIA